MSERDRLIPNSSKPDGNAVSGRQWRPSESQYGSTASGVRRFFPKFDFQRRHAWIVAIALTLGVIAIGLGIGLGYSREGTLAKRHVPRSTTAAVRTSRTTTGAPPAPTAGPTASGTTMIPINSSTPFPPPGRNASTISPNNAATGPPVLKAKLRNPSVSSTKTKRTASRGPRRQNAVRIEEEVPLLRKPKRRVGHFKRAAVASDGKPCAKIAKDILTKGGSAVDGAIAGLLCDGIVNAQSLGIGGGFVMTVYNQTSRAAETLIARETAPAASHPTMFVNDTEASVKGGMAVAIPGEIRGYWDAHQRYGKLPWKELFSGAIDLCENGSFVQPPLAAGLQKEKNNIIAEESLSEVFVDPTTGDVLKEGDMMYRKKLGETLREIAENGPEEFYTGKVASKLLDDLAGFGSIITAEDLASYTAEWRPAFVTRVQGTGMKLYTTPPPTSGPVLGFILKVITGYYNETVASELGNFRNWTISDQGLFLHRLTETFKHAYGRRANLGDPHFLSNDIGFRQTVTSFRDNRFAKFVRNKINDSATFDDWNHYGARFSVPADAGTAHLSVVDEDGLAVAVTSTINTQFGARIRSRSTGIILNNEMDDFATPGAADAWGQAPSPTNFPEPGKRPLSSMCPSILVDEVTGETQLIIGGAGGPKITTAVAYVLSLVLGGSENPADATETPRLHHQLFPAYVQHEDIFSKKLLDELISRGHEAKPYDSTPGSVVVSIGREADGWFAVSDRRKLGDVDGY